jgi:hypothetical protein
MHGILLLLPDVIAEPGIGLTLSGITAATRDRSGNLISGIRGRGGPHSLHMDHGPGSSVPGTWPGRHWA